LLITTHDTPTDHDGRALDLLRSPARAEGRRMSCRPLLALSGGVSSAASSHGTTGRSEAFRGNGRCSATPIRHPFRQFQYPTSPEHADLALKEKALARTAPLEAIPGRYQPTDTIMTFLDSL